MMNYNEKYPSRRRSAGRVFAYFEILLPSRQAVNKAPNLHETGVMPMNDTNVTLLLFIVLVMLLKDTTKK